jgi:hypothetical protein
MSRTRIKQNTDGKPYKVTVLERKGAQYEYGVEEPVVSETLLSTKETMFWKVTLFRDIIWFYLVSYINSQNSRVYSIENPYTTESWCLMLYVTYSVK